MLTPKQNLVRILAKFGILRPHHLSYEARDRFFSTKTAKVAEEISEKVIELSLELDQESRSFAC